MEARNFLASYILNVDNGGLAFDKNHFMAAIIVNEGVIVFLSERPYDILLTSEKLSQKDILKEITNSLYQAQDATPYFHKKYNHERVSNGSCFCYHPEYTGKVTLLNMKINENGTEEEKEEPCIDIAALKPTNEEGNPLTSAERPILVNAIANAVIAAAKVTGKSIASRDFEQAVKAVRETFAKGE